MREISERAAWHGTLEGAALATPNQAMQQEGSGLVSPLEEALLELVRTLVKVDDVGVDDDFFLIGGHSLMGTQLVMRVRERFGVPLTLRDLFEGATVAQLAIRVEAMLVAQLDAMSEEEATKQAVR